MTFSHSNSRRNVVFTAFHRNTATMILISICFFALFALSSCDVGDSCGNNTSERCVFAKDCKAATDFLKKGRHHGLKRCGFKGFDEIVCCPNPPRKSAIACDSFHNDPDYPMIGVFNGDNARLEEFPHMVALGYEDETTNNYTFDCGGSLISDNYILTAAHCLVRKDGKKPKIIRLGSIDLTDNAQRQDITVNTTCPHEKYDPFERVNDIAIIQLSKPAEMNTHVKPICLHMDESDPDDKLVTAGWGETGSTGKRSDFLLKIYLRSVALNECNITFSTRAFGRPIFDTQLCATSRDSIPRDTCKGDSGGPLQIASNRATLVGITSFGPLCGGSLPGIYTRVAKYLDWIEQMVWP